jgi:hypothetical protein
MAAAAFALVVVSGAAGGAWAWLASIASGALLIAGVHRLGSSARERGLARSMARSALVLAVAAFLLGRYLDVLRADADTLFDFRDVLAVALVHDVARDLAAFLGLFAAARWAPRAVVAGGAVLQLVLGLLVLGLAASISAGRSTAFEDFATSVRWYPLGGAALMALGCAWVALAGPRRGAAVLQRVPPRAPGIPPPTAGGPAVRFTRVERPPPRPSGTPRDAQRRGER